MSTQRYVHNNTVRTIAGAETIRQLPQVIGELGSSNPLLLISRAASASCSLESILKSEAETHPTINFDSRIEITSNEASSSLVGITARRYKENHNDALVAIGGGTVIDLAKAVNLVVMTGTASIVALEGIGKLHKPHGYPLIAVPTTIGSGSGATGTAYIRNSETDRIIRMTYPALFPDVTIIDPKLSRSASGCQTVFGAAAALGHAMEAMTSLGAQPISDQLALKAISLIVSHATRLVRTPFDIDARLNVALASHLAGTAASQTGNSLAHALSIAMSHVSHIPYGHCMMILLPHALTYNLHKTIAILARINRFLHEESEGMDRNDNDATSAETCLHELSTLLIGFCNGSSSTAVPSRFFDVGRQDGKEPALCPDQLETVAKIAMGSLDLVNSREELDMQDTIRVLEAAYWGYPLDRDIIDGHNRKSGRQSIWNDTFH